jgi:ethanolamine ammonia-lyase large subunit
MSTKTGENCRKRHQALIGQEMAIVTATKNAVDVRKRVASRLMPNQYGDQPGGVTINNQTNVMVVSEERLRHLQELRRKMIDGQKSEVG